jgi:hypothetical protein
MKKTYKAMRICHKIYREQIWTINMKKSFIIEILLYKLNCKEKIMICIVSCEYIIIIHLAIRVRVMMFNATFNNISVLSWRSVLLVEETRVPGENNRPIVSHWQTLSHNVVLRTPHLGEIQTHNVTGKTSNQFNLSIIPIDNKRYCTFPYSIEQKYHWKMKLISYSSHDK